MGSQTFKQHWTSSSFTSSVPVLLRFSWTSPTKAPPSLEARLHLLPEGCGACVLPRYRCFLDIDVCTDACGTISGLEIAPREELDVS